MPDVYFSILVAAALAALAQQHFKHSRSSQRRIYWACACVGAVAAFLAFDPDSKKGAGMAIFFLGVMTIAAYAYTPHIKLGGKIYALSVQDTRPDPEDAPAQSPTDAAGQQVLDPAPDAYSGMVTARKLWWIYVPVLFISAGNTLAFVRGEGDGWGAAIGIAFLVFLSLVSGYGDASWDYPIARGQRIQFGIAAVITAGTFTVLYLAAYYAGKRRPLRRKQSMEYRAHPRHRNPES